MSASIVFHLLAALAYIVLSISLWRPLTRGSTRTVLNAPSRVALLCAIIVHGAGLLLTIVLPQGLHLSWALALSAAIWLGMVVFWFQSLYLRLDSLLLILLPAATIVSLLAMAFPNGHIVNHVGNEWLRIHLMIALVAYGLSTVAALHAVLMTALVTAFALAPLLFEAERPGTEILHPVAVVIFSGLISSTLLDTFLTPAMFWLFGRKDVERLMADRDAGAL